MPGSLAAMTSLCFVSLHQTIPLGFIANVIHHFKFFLSFEVCNSTAQSLSFYQLLYVTAKCYSVPFLKTSSVKLDLVPLSKIS